MIQHNIIGNSSGRNVDQKNFRDSIISVYRLELSQCTFIKFYQTEKIKLNLDQPCFRQTFINVKSSIQMNFEKLRALQFGKIWIYVIELQHKSHFKPKRITNKLWVKFN